MLVVLIVIALAVLYTIMTYNGLIQLRNRVDNGWAQIDVQLQRRWDLIPKVAEVASAYLTHEHETLKQLTEARTRVAVAGSDPAARAEAEEGLTTALRQLFAVAEAYPDLKGNTVMMEVQRELSDTESKIGFARQFYNDTVMMFNTRIAMFPTSIIARMMGFTPREYFTVKDDARREMPELNLTPGGGKTGT
ncbi:MAG TPA: LemA family protein [Sphingobacteriaceae bacterium]|nr:LemA family protein [Sphingobacteriaceae bacterium]